jgi:hypothetical protein
LDQSEQVLLRVFEHREGVAVDGRRGHDHDAAVSRNATGQRGVDPIDLEGRQTATRK